MRKNVKHCKFRIILFIEICYFNYNKIYFVRLLCKGTNNTGNKRKRKYNENRFSRKSIETLMTKIIDKEFFQYFKAVSFDTSDSINVENIICSHSSIFIGGNIPY